MPDVTPTPSPSYIEPVNVMAEGDPEASPSVTPTITPSPTPSPDVDISPSVTPSITASPSVTPSITPTPSNTPEVDNLVTINVNGSVTASIAWNEGSGTLNINVSPAGLTWQATSDAFWLDFSNGTGTLNGTGSGTDTLSFENGDIAEREGTITIQGTGAYTGVSDTALVVQAPPPSVTPTPTVTPTRTPSLTPTPSPDIDGILNANVNGSVTASIAYDDSSGTFNLTVSPSTVTWSASIADGWADFSNGTQLLNGTGNATDTLAFTTNDITERETTITIVGTGGWNYLSDTVLIVQAPPPSVTPTPTVTPTRTPSLTPTPSPDFDGILNANVNGSVTASIAYDDSSGTFNLTVSPSTVTWSASIADGWADFSNGTQLLNGTGNATDTLAFTTNDITERETTITIVGTGGWNYLSDTVLIVQAPPPSVTPTPTVTPTRTPSLTPTPSPDIDYLLSALVDGSVTSSLEFYETGSSLTISTSPDPNIVLWEATSSNDWVLFSNGSRFLTGSGDYSETLTVAANTGAQRTNTITFKGRDIYDVATTQDDVLIIQTVATADTFLIDTLPVTFPNTLSSSSFDLTVLPEVITWEASGSDAWVSLVPGPTTGTGSATIEFRASGQALEASARTGSITATSQFGNYATYTFYQAAGASFTTFGEYDGANPDPQDLSYTSGSQTTYLEVQCSQDDITWEITSGVVWADFSAGGTSATTSGTGDTISIPLYIDENLATGIRSGSIQLAGTGDFAGLTPISIDIRQDGSIAPSPTPTTTPTTTPTPSPVSPTVTPTPTATPAAYAITTFQEYNGLNQDPEDISFSSAQQSTQLQVLVNREELEWEITTGVQWADFSADSVQTTFTGSGDTVGINLYLEENPSSSPRSGVITVAGDGAYSGVASKNILITQEGNSNPTPTVTPTVTSTPSITPTPSLSLGAEPPPPASPDPSPTSSPSITPSLSLTPTPTPSTAFICYSDPKPRTEISSSIQTVFADNESGAITPALLRSQIADIICSTAFLTGSSIMTGDFTITGSLTVTGSVTLTGDQIIILGLPTTEPAVTDQLWNDNGYLRISRYQAL